MWPFGKQPTGSLGRSWMLIGWADQSDWHSLTFKKRLKMSMRSSLLIPNWYATQRSQPGDLSLPSLTPCIIFSTAWRCIIYSTTSFGPPVEWNAAWWQGDGGLLWWSYLWKIPLFLIANIRFSGKDLLLLWEFGLGYDWNPNPTYCDD